MRHNSMYKIIYHGHIIHFNVVVVEVILKNK